MGERVATVDLQRILENIALQTRRRELGTELDVSISAARRHRRDLEGRAAASARRAPAFRSRDRARSTRASAASNTSDGETIDYDALISTMPLDRLLATIDGPDRRQGARRRASSIHRATSSASACAARSPDALKTKCWIYFPEPQVPFYRATVFSNYSPNNAPAGALVADGRSQRIAGEARGRERVVDEVVAGIRAVRLHRSIADVVSRWHRRLEHGYPTPWLGRDEVLQQVEHGPARAASTAAAASAPGNTKSRTRITR